MATKLTDVEITLTDLEAARQVLGACATFLAARDMMEAQLALKDYRPSALSSEVERMKTRFDAYMADVLLAERDAEEEEEAEETEEAEELTDDPLGKVALPQQEGRRVPLEELQEREAAAAANAESDPADGFA
jgi:hypothetical protein